MGNWIKNRKISAKLFLIVGMAIAAILLLGLLSFALMSQLRQLNDEITNAWLTGVDESRKADTYFTDLRLNERTYITATNESSRQTGLQETEALRQKLEEVIDTYYNTAESTDTEDIQLIETVGQTYKSYIALHDAMFAAADRGDTEEAIRLLEDEGMDAYYLVKNALTELAEYNADGAYAASDESSSLFYRATVLLVVIMAALIVLGTSTTLYIIRLIRKPVQELEQVAISLAQGSLDINLEYEAKDELGVLSDQMRELVRRLHVIIADENHLLGRLAGGDFTAESSCSHEYIGDFAPLLDSLDTIIGRLNDTMLQINLSSDEVSSGAEQVANGSQMLAQGSTEQASSVEELAASISDISQQVTQNAENAKTASRKANEVGGGMEESNRKMQEMIQAMSDINDSSHEIGKIIKTIEDIAFQTNILALNAAVEAARAGTAGKGFAVVADEVRSLAAKSDQAAKATKELIERSVKTVENGTHIADETAKSLLTAVEGAQEVERIVDEISAASSHQADTIGQITLGIDQISCVVQSNSATSEESAAASEELSSQAQVLRDLVGAFSLRNGHGSAPSAVPAPGAGAGGQGAGADAFGGDLGKY